MLENRNRTASGTRPLSQFAVDLLAGLDGPTFTLDLFIAAAIGVGIPDAYDISTMVLHLIETESIRAIPSPGGQPTRWMRCAQRG